VTDVTTDDVLSPTAGSVVPAGGATVAVFVTVPVVVAVPVTVIARESPPPAPNRTSDNEIALPDPDAVPHSALPADTHDHVTDVKLPGTVSATVTPDTSLGPLFVTATVYETTVPCTTDAGPLLTTARSAAGVTDVAASALSFARIGSVVPVGADTVAVFVKGPPLAVAVPVTITVTLLPTPASMFAIRLTALPVPESAPHAALPAATHVNDTSVRLLGTVSAIDAPVTSLGPLLVTVSVYVTGVPCTAVAGPVLAIARSAAGLISVVTDPVLFTETGSVVPTGGATDAVLVNAPVVVAVPVTVTVTVCAAPASNRTADNAIAFPVPDAVPHAAVPTETHVHDTPVRFDGTASAIEAPVTLDGPALVAVIVYVTIVS
jgi:hypothetical protein